MAANPPPLVSPVPSLQVRAVLDQDAQLTAGLTHAPGGQRVVLLVSAAPTGPGEREGFTEWCRALTDVCAVSRAAAVADYGHTDDGHPYLATYVHRSLADQLRLVGPPEPRLIRHMGATIADVLAASHSYGLLHGAVSPATVLMVDDGVRLGGYGATAPGLTGPLGVWAFTPPEHRAAAAAGESPASPSADVFALAATICVALAGVLPWSDPVNWADAAGLAGGPTAPRWATAIRSALDPNPDKRPTAEEMAEALRSPAAPLPDRPRAAKVDLRGLIPRKVRRLAAYSIDAMADDPSPVIGRAAPGAGVKDRRDGVYRTSGRDEPPTGGTGARAGAAGVVGAAGKASAGGKPGAAGTGGSGKAGAAASRLNALVRKHRGAAAASGMVAAVLVAAGAYAWARSGTTPPTSPNTPVAHASVAPSDTVTALLAGARQVGEDFLHNLGANDPHTCTVVHGNAVITTKNSKKPITCATLLSQDAQLLGSRAMLQMRTARVGQAVGYDNGGVPDPDMHAVITLLFVPDLQGVFSRFEMVLTHHAGQWWVIQVTFG